MSSLDRDKTRVAGGEAAVIIAVDESSDDDSTARQVASTTLVVADLELGLSSNDGNDDNLNIMTIGRGGDVVDEAACLLDSQGNQSSSGPLTNTEVIALPRLSGLSASSCSSLNKAMCRICHGEEDINSKSLIHPCSCSGTLRHVHQTCLLKWLTMSGSKKCELCQQSFLSKRKLNPVRDLRWLEMDSREKKVLVLNNLLYLIGVMCNLWSEFNFLRLISDMIRTNNMNWKFYIILFLCLTNNFCILALAVLISQYWYNLFKRLVRINQSVVILSRQQ